MQRGGGDWTIRLDKHDEEHGTEPRKPYMECVCERDAAALQTAAAKASIKHNKTPRLVSTCIGSSAKKKTFLFISNPQRNGSHFNHSLLGKKQILCD